MYSKEQIETRLRLGHGMSVMELSLMVTTLFSRLEEMEKKYEELSKHRQGSDCCAGETIQPAAVRSKPKQ